MLPELTPQPLTFRVLLPIFAVCRLAPTAAQPGWMQESIFYSISRSPLELSIICEQRLVPPSVRAERGWRLMHLQGPVNLNLTGITARFASALAEARINLCTIATFDTDYLLVRVEDYLEAVFILERAGFRVVE